MAEKKQFELEFNIRTSSKILYNMISTASGLAEWFADDVNLKDDTFIFIWDGAEEIATLATRRPNDYVKFQWEVDEGTDYYLEFNIKIDDITKDVALVITDFAEEDEMDEAKNLWTSQVDDLKRILGS